ncbi:hypothetical protein ACP275_13G062600 [Erythranthe tilingii]
MANFSTANETNFLNMQSYDDLNEVELLEYIDSCTLLVMSLLEQDDDSKVEGIIINGSDDQRFETCSTSSDEYSEDSLFSDVEQIESCSTSPDDLGFEWMDTDINYFIDNNHFRDEIETANMVINDYSNICYYGTMPVEEEVEYIDLWQ